MSTITKDPNILTDAKLFTEAKRCEFCQEKACKKGCPADCSPADFIMAVKGGLPVDFKRAANIILQHNPLGGVCGAVCPNRHCMAACVHKSFDYAINIPAIQATIIAKAKLLNYLPKFTLTKPNGKKVAVIGAGPAGLGAAAVLAQEGYKVTVFEKDSEAGGMCHLIPDTRLAKEVLRSDIDFIRGLGAIEFVFNHTASDAESYLKQDFDAIIVSTGLDTAIKPNIPGGDHVVLWDKYLRQPNKFAVKNKRIAVIGGGAIATDCAVTAKVRGASEVDVICLENNPDMPLTDHERQELLDYGIGIVSKTAVTAIKAGQDKAYDLLASKINFPRGGVFRAEDIVPNSEKTLRGYDLIIAAIGGRSTFPRVKNSKVFYAGDVLNGPTTVVEAVASGKNAATELHAALTAKSAPKIAKNIKSSVKLAGTVDLPVPLNTDFFGRPIISPFLLSAAPPSDGYDSMRKAYLAGWAGGVMKTAFDDVHIHIPAAYMFVYNLDTYANCDNVSEHPLDRVCEEIAKLVKEFPDRLTLGSTGGPVTGDDAADKKGWQSNTRKLERAGAMGIEYSLSCPQGGDGTEGDIVSQNAKLTAKIIDWVMEISDPEIPKLFKLTAAVTSIYPIVAAIKQVFAKYPNKKAGITLANSFPTIGFRPGTKKNWEEAVITGMSGDGVKNISYLTLANVAPLGVVVSGNGGPMDYKAAADFLALGVKNVQFCTVVMRDGVNVIEHLHSGLSYLMQDRGIKSMQELIGRALPNPVTGFMDLSPDRQVSAVNRELCEHCGNCGRCPYLAIEMDEETIPRIDPMKCVGCSICVKKCFSRALYLRDRKPEEKYW